MSRYWPHVSFIVALCLKEALGLAIATKEPAIARAIDGEPTPLAKRAPSYTYYTYSYYTYTSSSSTITYRSDPTGKIIAGVVTTLIIVVLSGIVVFIKKRKQKAKIAKINAGAAAKQGIVPSGNGFHAATPITVPATAYQYQYPAPAPAPGVVMPVPITSPAPSAVPVDAVGQFSNNYRYLITPVLEGKLRTSGWLPTTDPDNISAEDWQTRYGVDAAELAKLKEAYAWQRAMNT
ncbi:hypothetical protein FRC18_005699 [Serendipita sp. 400]|nr:hypothetical protein FRC18_005699 [Serendipita sp. 400]